MIRVKICGITNTDDALAAAEAGADALGFIFYKESKRYIEPENVRAILEALPPFVTAVGVFVNETRDSLEQIAETTGIGVVQLHGDEPPEFCSGFSRPVIRALRVGEGFGEAEIAPYADAGVTTFLLDKAKDGFYGGTGEIFDWKAAVTAKRFGRVILSGGLTADNVSDGIASVSPYALDVCSGVECEPGRKDHEKVRAFIVSAMRAGTES